MDVPSEERQGQALRRKGRKRSERAERQARGHEPGAEPGEATPDHEPGRSEGWLRRLTRYCWRYRRNVLLSFGASLAGMAVMALVPLVPRLIIDDVIVAHERPLGPWAGLLIVAAVAVYVSTYLRRYYGGRLALDVQHDMRTEMFRALTRLDGARQDQLDTGQVVGRATSDLQMIQGLLFILPMVIGNLLMFALSVVVMLTLSPLLTVVALAVAPALWFLSQRSRKRLFPATWYAQAQAAAVASIVEGSVTGVRVVKGFGQEDQEMTKLQSVSRTLFGARLRTIRLNSRYTPAFQAVPALGQVGMLALGGWMATHGNITLGTFVAFSAYLAQLTGPVRMLSMLLTVGQQARASVERVLELIDTKPTLHERPDARTLPQDADAVVEFDSVTFAYDQQRAVLHDLSFTVAPGETLALVGASGSGKSTASLLLPRFYEVNSGSIRVGGHDVRDLTFDSLRSAIGMVPEDSFLFSDTVRANLLYGQPDADEERMLTAARAAQADGFIRELPEGYDTVVGEQGMTLSGGQRQRIALARAILTDPRLLLLDDATSAVDAQVESEIHDALHSVMQGRTTLLIAHRRSTLQLADRIAVLERGRLVDVGTHEELNERCPLYRQLLADPDALAADTITVDPASHAASNGGSAGHHGQVTTDRTRSTEHTGYDGYVPSMEFASASTDDPADGRQPTNGHIPSTDPSALSHGQGSPHADEQDPRPEELPEPQPANQGQRAGGAQPAITAELWQRSPQDESADGQPRAIDRTGSGSSITSAPTPVRHGGGLGAGMSGAPLTPELAAQINALPPVTDVPEVDEREASAADASFNLRRALRAFRVPLALSFLFVAIDAIAGLLLPILIRHGIDDGVQRLALGAVWTASALGLVVVFTQWAAQTGETLMTGRTGERVLYSLRIKIFAQLQRLGLDYYERELSGRIMTRMTTDVDALSTFLQTGLVTAVVSLVTFFGILVALLVIDAGLALVVFAVLPVLVVATMVFRRKSVKVYELARERISTVNADLQENVAGLRIVQAFRREDQGARAFAERSRSYLEARVRGQWYISIYFPFVQFLSSVAAALVLIVGAGRVNGGTLTTGALVAYLLYIDLFFSPVQQLSQVFDGYQQASVSLGRIRDLLRMATTTPESPQPRPLEKLAGSIEFDDVHFSYRGDEEAVPREAMAGVTLRIPAGQTVAFVGETGAGKSTLVKLVARFYDTTSGTVRVDGVDVRDYGLTAYRRRLGVVPQEPYLFPGTVRDCIAYGRPDASDAEVEAAARAVGAHEMVATLDDGYLHRVAERGRNLSAGQRQLVALARAELVKPDILLLDEATAALDMVTEGLVNRATERLSGRRTTLVVAHRLTTAARADRVVVLDQGRVVEDGTHAELLRAEGRYAQLWRTYQGASGDSDVDALRASAVG